MSVSRRNESGWTLTLTLAFLAATLLVFGAVMAWVINNARITQRNNQFNLSEAAAEAATEKVLSRMNYDYVSQSITNSGNWYGSQFLPTTNEQASWPVQYIFSDTNGVANQISVNLGVWTTNAQPLNSQFYGLYGEIQPCTITATATPVGQSYNTPASVCESIQFASIPLFQFAIFYNMDLEIAAAQTLNIAGPVFSNGGIWSGSTTVSFANTVAAVGNVSNMVSDPFCSGYTGSGPSTYIPGQPTQHNTRLTMPIGTNNDPATIEALVNLPPTNYAMATANAFTTNGQYYFANAADLYLTNFVNGTNWGSLTPVGTNMILYYQSAVYNWPYLTNLPYDLYVMTNRVSHTIFTTNFVSTNASAGLGNATNIIWAGYSFITNVTFYDWREGWNGGSGVNSGKGKQVQAVQIDVAKFNVWLTNDTWKSNGAAYFNNLCWTNKSHAMDSIYIWSSVPLQTNGLSMPAVRVANGGMLPVNTAPKGFTVASAMPLYILGSYNYQDSTGSSLSQNSTTHTWPAAFMADSITILSGSWSDTVYSKKPSAASATTVNAALVAGIVRSTNSVYSGGVENFLRTLEDWGSSTLWWNGSIIVMFPSRYATNSWQQTGNYYGAPNRKWAFDTNFLSASKLPPMTPQSKGVIRGSWAPANH